MEKRSLVQSLLIPASLRLTLFLEPGSNQPMVSKLILKSELRVAFHAWNPRTSEAESGGLLCGQGQLVYLPQPVRFQFQASLRACLTKINT